MPRNPLMVTLLFSLSMVVSCVEEFTAETLNFEDILVVEAKLTDKVEQQRIFLSRTSALLSDSSQNEVGANVRLVDDAGNRILFLESSPGVYTSATILELSHDKAYRLEIETRDNLKYKSSWESLPERNDLSDMAFKKVSNDSGEEGVSVAVQIKSKSQSPSYFRYEYDETYQIIAPEYNGVTWDEVDYDYFGDGDGWEVTIKLEREESRICYGKGESNDIILASTELFDSDATGNFEFRFLSKDNYVISNRYSILVKQYSLHPDTYTFYNTIDSFSDFESVFHSIQPGAVESNIKSENGNTIAIGYFDLSSYSEKRLFLSYTDFFPDSPLPPYPVNCKRIFKPELYTEGFHATAIHGYIEVDGASNSPLMDGILSGQIGFYAQNPDYDQSSQDLYPERAPYLVKPLGCSDCRALGSNVRPDFWID